ncbi:hypothetical protein STANM309S_04303 [Streptomyces tanashiensis]
MGDGPPAVAAGRGVVDADVAVVLGAAQGPYALGRLHDDLGEARKGEEQGVVDRGEETLGQVLGGGVPQREDDDGVVAVGCGALGGQREPEQRHVAVAAAQFVAEARAVPGGLGGQFARLGEGPPDAAVPAQDGGLVGDGEDGGEADAEAAHGAVGLLALGRGAEGGERLGARGVQRGAGVRGGENGGALVVRGVQGQPETAGDTGAVGGVGGVLGEFDDEAVAVAAERQVLLGVGVLAEPGGRGAPGVEHAPPQPCGAEGIGSVGRRPDADAHV